MSSLEARVGELLAKWRADIATAPPGDEAGVMLGFAADDLAGIVAGGRVGDMPGVAALALAPEVVAPPEQWEPPPPPPAPAVVHLIGLDGQMACCTTRAADLPIGDPITTVRAQQTCAPPDVLPGSEGQAGAHLEGAHHG